MTNLGQNYSFRDDPDSLEPKKKQKKILSYTRAWTRYERSKKQIDLIHVISINILVSFAPGKTSLNPRWRMNDIYIYIVIIIIILTYENYDKITDYYSKDDRDNLVQSSVPF